MAAYAGAPNHLTHATPLLIKIVSFQWNLAIGKYFKKKYFEFGSMTICHVIALAISFTCTSLLRFFVN